MAADKMSTEEILQRAVDIPDPGERKAFLDRACAGDATLRAEVESLLEAHVESGAFLDVPVLDPGVTLEAAGPSEGPGTVIGRYKLLEKIGEGGMATVYMAEQKRPMRRRVALKLIKLGMDSKQVIARFEAERQALALMDHPNIAKVLDAGTTETGRPYFVMELVKGISITEFCDKNNLNTHERLELFVSVCQAVHHAHQKGIIHRDIKPSNIMVTLHDGQPVPKVIDFGIAKAVNQQLTEKTVFTRYAQMIGTPEYMSPEQAEMSGLDVDIRTDVFSLGVLLYELLTGATPFDSEYLLSKGYAELQRIIREEEPTRPSTKISTLGEALTAIAKHRCTSPDSLRKLIQTDLDWIVMKTLEKDRSRRYESISEFVADIRRHLNHEPVLAGRPSTVYRIRKFVQRRRALVAATAAIAAVIIVGFVVSTAMYVQAEQARQEEALAREQEVAARLEAQSVADFLTDDLLASVYPEKAKSPEVTVRYILQTAAENLENRFANSPLVEAKIRTTLGLTYQKLGDYQAPEPHFKRALEIRRQQLGEEDPLTLASLHYLSALYVWQGRYTEAEPIVVKLIETRSRILGKEHPDTLDCMCRLGYIYTFCQRFNDAEVLFVKILEIGRRVLNEEHDIMQETRRGLAIQYIWMSRLDEAMALVSKGFEISCRVLGEENEKTLYFMNQLAWVYEKQKRYDAAQELSIKALKISQRVVGEEHQSTIQAMNMLGWTYAKQGQVGKAFPLLIKSVALSRQVLGKAHQFTWFFTTRLADLYPRLGFIVREQYQTGEYGDARAAMTQLKEAGQVLHGDSSALKGEYKALDIALTAMYVHQLGRDQEAKSTLDQLRRTYEHNMNAYEEEYLYRAEQVFAGAGSSTYQVWELIEGGELKQAAEAVQALRAPSHDPDPVAKDGTQSARKALARAYCVRAGAAEACGNYAQAFSDCEAAVEVHPNYALSLRELAWLCATCPTDDIRDGDRALELATQACEMTHLEKAEYIDALAAAHAEMGSFSTAAKWQKTAIGLLREEERSKWQTDYEWRLTLYSSGKPYRGQQGRDAVAWWNFDQAIDGKVIDSSCNGFDGELMGDATIIDDAERGGVLCLKGNGYADCGVNSAFDITGPITISCWIKVNQFTRTWQDLISKGDSAWRLGRNLNSGATCFGCTGLVVQSDPLYCTIRGTGEVNDGHWHHVIGVYDGMKMKLFVDSDLDISAKATGRINTNSEPVHIGKNSEKPGRMWNGLIDDVRIYNYALSEIEIEALYSDEKPDTAEK
jgi:eukaryotic-like serine/threonine-protein kinase